MVGLRAMYTNWLNFRVYICNPYPTSVSISVCRNACNPCRFPYIGMYYMYVIHVIFYISACIYTRLSNVMLCEELQKCKNYLRNRVCRLTALHPQVLHFIEKHHVFPQLSSWMVYWVQIQDLSCASVYRNLESWWDSRCPKPWRFGGHYLLSENKLGSDNV